MSKNDYFGGWTRELEDRRDFWEACIYYFLSGGYMNIHSGFTRTICAFFHVLYIFKLIIMINAIKTCGPPHHKTVTLV